jgi:uncharacterized membrane protein
MLSSRIVRTFLCLSLFVLLMGAMVAPVFADDATTTPPAPSLSLDSKFPSISADSGSIYTFDVNIVYTGSERKTFTMDVTVPQGWLSYTSSGYPEKEITSIEITPGAYGSTTEAIKLYMGPNYGVSPDPGDYPITLKVSSGALTSSITLTAKVKAKYAVTLKTESGNLATRATAGKENHFSFNIVNSGSAAIDQLKLSASTPSGWTVSFKPETVDSLNAGQTQQVDAVITPTEGKTIAGDYMITLKADNGKNTASMDVRVTVETPSIWGWLAFIIVVVVILGLLVLFWKMGRR